MDLKDITNKKYSFIFGNKSDVGRVREINEDYMASFASSSGHFFIVCDGMGGHTSGEIASRLAVTTIKEFVTNNSENSKSTKQLLTESIQFANQTIIDKTIENPEYAGMGTTCVALCIKTGIVYYANVGDSRLYIVRNNKIYQLTKDQSFVQTLIDQGHISYDEAESHPRKNELIQALGITENVVPEINKVGLQIFKGDKFILCSDGLSGFVSDETILSTVVQNDVYTASEKLVTAANENGGFDNITVQIIDISEGDNLPEDLKTVPPLGALDKHITVSTFARDNKSTRQIPEFDFGNPTQKKKSNKVLISLTTIFVLIVFFSSMYVIFFYDKAPKTILSNNDSPKKDISQDNNLTFANNNKILTEFFKKIYIGEKADTINTEHLLQSFSTISFDVIKYKGALDKEAQDFSLKDVINNISKNNLIFERYDVDKRILFVKDAKGKTNVYKVYCIANEPKVTINGIEFDTKPLAKDEKTETKKTTEKKESKKILIEDKKKQSEPIPPLDEKKIEPKKEKKKEDAIF